jgi:hypothetical protein
MLKKGEVVLLDDPEGITWILKAWVTTADLTLTCETLPALRTKLKVRGNIKTTKEGSIYSKYWRHQNSA